MAAAAAIAIGIWWTANTVSHLFIHHPFFRRRAANAWCAAGLTAVLGFPQSVWRDRHLAHHAGRAFRLRFSGDAVAQAALVVTLWIGMAARAPEFWATVYMPGYIGALLLCALHGHYEHAAGATSHYGRLYNALCFNDGYHVEHHLHPGRSWSDLPSCRATGARTSGWPAPLRWLDAVSLETLERVVLRAPVLQRVVLRLHARAIEPLVAALPAAPRVAIVGGGLFPRTALVLRQLLPRATITIVDANRANLDCAAALLDDDHVSFVHARFPFQSPAIMRPIRNPQSQWDLVVFPLAFDGDREAIYSHPPAPAVIVHDWLWHRRGTSRIVSLALLKRVNLVSAA